MSMVLGPWTAASPRQGAGAHRTSSAATCACRKVREAARQAGTQFSVAFGDTLYVGSQITLCTGLASAVQFSLVNTGEGTLILAASNNFTASTQMNGGGTLVLANPAALSASQQLIINSGMVDFSAITSVFPLMGLGGNGGSLVLANTNGSPVNVSVGGGNGTTTYSGLLTGSGSLTLTGGHLTLSGFNNSYNATNLNGGVLTLGSPSANGTGAITFSGGTLQYTSAASGISDLSPQFNTTATSQKFNIDTGGLNVSYSGSLTGANGVLTKFGLGELILTGSNNYTGGTNITGGLLEFASSTASPAIPSTNAITINSGGALVDSSTVQGWLTNGKIRGSSNGAIALTSSSSDPSINFTNVAGGFPNLSLGALGSVTYGGTITPQGGYNFGGGGGTLFLTGRFGFWHKQRRGRQRRQYHRDPRQLHRHLGRDDDCGGRHPAIGRWRGQQRHTSQQHFQ